MAKFVKFELNNNQGLIFINPNKVRKILSNSDCTCLSSILYFDGDNYSVVLGAPEEVVKKLDV